MVRSDDAGEAGDLARSEMETLGFEARQTMPSPINLPNGTLLAQRYRILGLLGVGGMGAVYAAENERIGRRVALKLVTTDKGPGHAELMRRFEIEARAAADLGHEHIVDVLDVGELTDGTPFLVMEHLDGRDLEAALKADGPFSVGRLARVLVPICEALEAVHGKGVVHRDLKPANIFLTKGDAEHPKILDFGISKLPANQGETQTGVALGTPGYMSPEQARGLRDVDARSDIFSLGVIAYELLAGERPFSAPSVPVLLLRILNQEPVPIEERRGDLPDGVVRLVREVLAKDASMRTPSARHFADALRPFLDEDQTPVLRNAPAVEPENVVSANVIPVSAVPQAGTASTNVSGGASPAIPVRRVGAFGAALALALVGSVAVSWAGSSTPVPSPATNAMLEVRLQIQTSPSDAHITLDGHPLNAPVDITRPRDLDFLTLRVEAPGFETHERTLVLDHDQSLSVSLEEAVLEGETLDVEEPAEARPRERTRRREHEARRRERETPRLESMTAESAEPMAASPVEEPDAPRGEGGLRREF